MLNYFRIFLGIAVLTLLFVSLNDDYENGSIRAVFRRTPIFLTEPPKSIIYWGQNKLKIEVSLGDLCDSTNHEMIIITYVRKYFSTNGYPALSISDHCTTTAFPSDTFGVDFYPLTCPSVGADIKKCQALGKKVLISLSPTDKLMTDANAKKFARSLFDTFLGGKEDKRPFGDAVLDGVDIYVRTDDVSPLKTFVEELNGLMVGDNARSYVITGSPYCSFPDGILGPNFPNSILQTVPNLVNAIILQARSSPDCTFFNEAIMYTTIKKWIDWVPETISLYISLPAANGHVDDAPGDYIPVDKLANFTLNLKRISSKSTQPRGFAVWEGSAEQLEVCDNDESLVKQGKLKRKRRYGDILREAIDGTLTVPCEPIPESKSPTVAPPPNNKPTATNTRRNNAAVGINFNQYFLVLLISLITFQ